MSEGFIDSASVYEVVAALSYGRPEDCDPWAWQGAIVTSCALACTENIKLAPSPARSYVGASGPYGALLALLGGIMGSSMPEQRVMQAAQASTKRWETKHRNQVQTAYEQLKGNEAFGKWVDWALSTAWLEHSRRLNGLFDPAFIPQIAPIIGVDKQDLSSTILPLSRDVKVVEDYAKRQPDEDNFRAMLDAYVVSVLIRGRYHEAVARGSGLQIIQHPVRYPVLPSAEGKPGVEFRANTAQYLSNIVLAGAFSERSYEARIGTWAESVSKVKRAHQAGAIDLRGKDTDEVALDLAVRHARHLGIRTHERSIERAVDASVALGVGILTSFFLVGWAALITSGITYAATEKKRVGELVAHKVLERKSRLQDLAVCEPGRVEQTWKR